MRTFTRVEPLACVVGLLVLIGCGGGGSSGASGGRSAEPLPVRGGDYLQYRRVDNGPVVQIERRSISDTAEGSLRYTVTVTTYHEQRPSHSQENVNKDYVTDRSGLVLRNHDPSKQFGSLGKEQVEGRLIQVWLPASKQQSGEGVELEGFPSPLAVGDQVSWERWTVWPVALRGHRYYFDVNTGFLVGREWERQKWVLEDSSLIGL